MWQDIAITIISIIFGIALAPQVMRGFKTKKATVIFSTALVTFLGAYVVASIYFTLKLYSAMIIQVLLGTLWFALFIQSIIYKK
ncbi:hypothetical protein M0R19_00380 [Candidatus Pacearchaeota archaeon]|nr:hypothetical protein [Candidatus Pacearchaeota archaeon]